MTLWTMLGVLDSDTSKPIKEFVNKYLVIIGVIFIAIIIGVIYLALK